MKKILILYTINLFFGLNLLAQSKIDILNNQKKELLKKIEENNQKILTIQNSKKITIKELTIKENNLNLNLELKNNIENQIAEINLKLGRTVNEIDSITNRLELNRKQLVVIYKKYYKRIKKSDFDILLFILSSNSFNQAFSRIKFYKSLITYYNNLILSLKKQKIELENTRKNYILLLKDLKVKEIELQNTINQIRFEKINLRKTIKRLETRRNDLLAELNKSRKRIGKINREIRKIIADNAKSKKLMTKENSILYKKLTKKFMNKKGKLPEPVNNYTIIGRYGERPHPILKNVKVKNNGIDLLLNKDNSVYSIEEGEVSKVFNIPYGGKAVIIRHGGYLTLYSNLSRIFVKPGDYILPKVKIGSILKQNDNTYILHFELWNEKEPENPSDWIKFN